MVDDWSVSRSYPTPILEFVSMALALPVLASNYDKGTPSYLFVTFYVLTTMHVHMIYRLHNWFGAVGVKRSISVLMYGHIS